MTTQAVVGVVRRRFPLVPIVAVVTSLIAGDALVSHSKLASLVLVAVCLAGLMVVTFNVAPERVFLGWFLVAPFLQASSRNSSVGHLLSQVLFTLPPILFLLWAAIARRTAVRASFVDVLPAAYFALAVVSLELTKVGSSASLRGIVTTVGFAAVAYYFAAFGPVSEQFGERLCRVVLITASILGVMGLIEEVTGWNLWHNTDWRDPTPRVVATLDNPAVLGIYLSIAIAVSLVVLFWDGPAKLRRLAVLTLVVAVPTMVFTYTRGPFLGLFAVAVPLLLLRKSIRARSVIVLAIGGFLLVLFWGSFAGSSVYQKRVSDSATVQTRVVIQNWSLKLASQKPILGWGYGSFDRVKNTATDLQGTDLEQKLGTSSTSHDTFLTILVELGAIGLVLFLAPWAIILWRLRQFIRVPSEHRWFGIVCIATPIAFALGATTFDLRFFSFIGAVPWIAMGCGRRLTAGAD
ncbi:MAG: O-antigen ligase family protein [Actinobacteria bacterium]|nr:O-antigen ligase family protein [Actinomycetota bacterium]